MQLLDVEDPVVVKFTNCRASIRTLSFASWPTGAGALGHDEFGLHARDRILVDEWRDTAQAWGFGRIELCKGNGAFGVGDYLMVFERDRNLPSWGVGRESGEYLVWRNGHAGYIGRCDTLRDALNLVLVQPKRARRRSLAVR